MKEITEEEAAWMNAPMGPAVPERKCNKARWSIWVIDRKTRDARWMTDIAVGPDAIWEGSFAEAEESIAERKRVHGRKFDYEIMPAPRSNEATPAENALPCSQCQGKRWIGDASDPQECSCATASRPRTQEAPSVADEVASWPAWKRGDTDRKRRQDEQHSNEVLPQCSHKGASWLRFWSVERLLCSTCHQYVDERPYVSDAPHFECSGCGVWCPGTIKPPKWTEDIGHYYCYECSEKRRSNDATMKERILAGSFPSTVDEIVSAFLCEPGGCSDARRALLELNEEGQVTIDDQNLVSRLNQTQEHPTQEPLREDRRVGDFSCGRCFGRGQVGGPDPNTVRPCPACGKQPLQEASLDAQNIMERIQHIIEAWGGSRERGIGALAVIRNILQTEPIVQKQAVEGLQSASELIRHTNNTPLKNYALTCEGCGILSPIVSDEDEVVDTAIDAGWMTEGTNEDDRDACPSCQKQPLPYKVVHWHPPLSARVHFDEFATEKGSTHFISIDGLGVNMQSDLMSHKTAVELAESINVLLEQQRANESLGDTDNAYLNGKRDASADIGDWIVSGTAASMFGSESWATRRGLAKAIHDGTWETCHDDRTMLRTKG